MFNINKQNFNAFLMKKTKSDIPSSVPTAFAGFRLCIVIDGNARWNLSGKTYNIKKGDIILLDSTLKRFFVEFGTNGLKLSVFSLNSSAFVNPYHLLFYVSCVKNKDFIIQNEKLYQMLFVAYHEAQSKVHLSHEMISAKLTEFFISAERYLNFNSDYRIKFDKNMARILNYIDSNITNSSLAALAEMSGYSESSFSRWFSDLNGIPYKKYIMLKKIEHAISLLKTTDMKMIDIAYECGFESVSGFYDTFKKVTGTTPKKYFLSNNV